MEMKAFVISLSKIESSITSAKEVLEQLLEYGFDAELFEGTYGDEAVVLFKKDRRKAARFGIKVSEDSSRLECTRVEAEKIKRPGVLGCFYSHYRLWQKCVELDETIFIFEDDVIFEREYHPVEFEDILMVCLGKEAYKHRIYSKLLYEPEGDPEAIALRNSSMPGAVGYGITPSGAKKLVNAYKKEMLPADTAMNVHVVKLECHSHLMGRAAIEEDGKISLTSSNMWGKSHKGKSKRDNRCK
jgi:GR25 family glycosyltransferase involved in LPS biosynthesis